MRIQTAFELGMKRIIPELYGPANAKLTLNLGPGNHPVQNAINIGLPQWNAELQPIPQKDGSIGCIYAFHFFEHLENPIEVLRECERVLEVGGHMLVVVPYGTCHMAAQDLTHKHFFNEDTWKELFNNEHYAPEAGQFKPWQLRVHFNMIMGVKGTNLALFTQFIKGKAKTDGNQ